MKSLWIYFIVLIFCISCSQDQKSNEKDIEQADSEKAVPKNYFPVVDFLKSEIKAVDSLPVGIKKYTTSKGKTDSTYIKSEEFHKLTQEFMHDELAKGNFEREFEETSFFDRSTKTSTFLYTTKNPNLEIQRVDVLSTPGDTYDKVKSIYIEKVIEKGDSSEVKKLYWKVGDNFQINTELKIGSMEPVVTFVKVGWNYWD